MKKNNLVEQVRQLREETGAGIMDCKQAVEKAGGSLKRAREIIKKSGLAKVAKKQSRETKQGWVGTYTHATGKIGVVVELLCETDFVARNKDFQKLVQELCLQVAGMKPKTIKALLAQEYIRDSSRTIDGLIKEAIAKFGENIKIGRFERLEI